MQHASYIRGSKSHASLLWAFLSLSFLHLNHFLPVQYILKYNPSLFSFHHVFQKAFVLKYFSEAFSHQLTTRSFDLNFFSNFIYV